MKKSFLMLVVALSSVGLVGCKGGSEAEIAVVTDVGQLRDGGFNQGTYEGAKGYAEANGKTYQYYAPANGSNATDDDRIAARELAVKNKAKVIVAPGYLQAAARRKVAKENPDVKFIFVDGWTLTDSADAKGNDNGEALKNVTAITYKEQEAGYRAGYAVVKGGYKQLGGTFGGGGANPACNRYAYGFAQGANEAAKERNLTDVSRKVSFEYGENFTASTSLQTQISGWYSAGTQVVFACGGSMFQSVKAAAEASQSGKIVGVDVDQAPLSERVITSATKGLSTSVELALTEFYSNEWDTKLGGKTQTLGAVEGGASEQKYVGLGDFSRLSGFTSTDYSTLFDKIAKGEIVPDGNTPDDCKVDSVWANETLFDTIEITLVK